MKSTNGVHSQIVLPAFGNEALGDLDAPKVTRGKKKETEKPLSLQNIELHQIVVPIMGDSPLLVHRFSEKAKKQMRDKQTGKGQQKKAAKDVVQDFLDSFEVNGPDRPEAYVDDREVQRARAVAGSPFAMKATCFKCAIVGAVRHADGMKMTNTWGAFHVIGEFVNIITGEDPVMREDVVRLAGPGGVADLRHRGEFRKWSADLSIRYNARSITPDQLVNLINIAGFSSGVGEWRPERHGQMGMFSVDPTRPFTQIDLTPSVIA